MPITSSIGLGCDRDREVRELLLSLFEPHAVTNTFGNTVNKRQWSEGRHTERFTRGRHVMIAKVGNALYFVACLIALITIAHVVADYFSQGVFVPQPLLGCLSFG